jgi:hypothetical protein
VLAALSWPVDVVLNVKPVKRLRGARVESRGAERQVLASDRRYECFN